MKPFLKPCYMLLVLAMAYMPVAAQEEQPVKPTIPRWVPKTGYWVAENNAQQPKQCTIYFYTNDHVLVYKETIEGVKVDLDSRKVKMRLKKVLQTSLLAYQKHWQAKENEGLVISLLQER